MVLPTNQLSLTPHWSTSRSVPLHIYVTLVISDVSFYVHMAGYWFSYLLLIVVYPVFLTMLWKLKFEE